MNEFLQAELEAGQTEAVRHREKAVEKSHQKRSRGTVAKRTRSQSTETGSSAKRTRREPEAKVPSKGIQHPGRSLNHLTPTSRKTGMLASNYIRGVVEPEVLRCYHRGGARRGASGRERGKCQPKGHTIKFPC